MVQFGDDDKLIVCNYLELVCPLCSVTSKVGLPRCHIAQDVPAGTEVKCAVITSQNSDLKKRYAIPDTEQSVKRVKST